jgi:hypothetical protein
MKLYFHAVEAAAESWDIVKSLPDYRILVGELLFRQIFELAPAAMSLYHFGNGLDCTQRSVPDMVYAMPSFKRHAERVVETLEAALTMMLGNDMHDLALTLQHLGARHLEYGVLPHHYRTVETAFLRTLEKGLKEKWTEGLKKGWQAVFKFLAKAMICGCEYELEIVKEERSIKERRIKLHTTPRMEFTMELERLKASSNECSHLRWIQSGYVEPFTKSTLIYGKPETLSIEVKRRSFFDTSPALPKRSHIDEEDETKPTEETNGSGHARARCKSDSMLQRPRRCHSPEPIMVGQCDTLITDDPAG